MVRGFGQLEAAIMDRLWNAAGPTTVREVHDAMLEERGLAYTTVMTVMDTLHRKGWLQRDRHGRAYRYWPSASREEHVAELMRDALGTTQDQAATLVRFTEHLNDQERATLRSALRRAAARPRA